MNIAETIYQHVKMMPMSKALEVLQFVSFLETKKPFFNNIKPENDILEFINNLPFESNRSDREINQSFQSLRDEWE